MKKPDKEGIVVWVVLISLLALWGLSAAEQEAKAPPPTIHSYTIVLENGNEIDISAVDCHARQSDLRGLAESHPLLLKVECWSDNNSWFGDVFNGLAVAVIKN